MKRGWRIEIDDMPKSSACLNARASLEEIRTLKQDFVVAYDRAVTSQIPDDIQKAQELKRELEGKMTALQEVVEAERERVIFDTINQVLGFEGENKMFETEMLSAEGYDNLSDEYRDAHYPLKKVTEPYLAERQSWFTDEYWKKMKTIMLQTINRFAGSKVLVDTAIKPDGENGGLQQYKTQDGNPDPMLKLLKEYQESVGDKYPDKKDYPLNPASRFNKTGHQVSAFCEWLQTKIINALQEKGIEVEAEEITVTPTPAILLNKLMIENPDFQPSSKTNTGEYTADIFNTDAKGNNGGVLMAGNSVYGGAAYLSDRGRVVGDVSRGFRPAVIVRGGH